MSGACSILFSMLLALGPGGAKASDNPSAAHKNSPVIVVGFLGGYVRHDDAVHSVVQVAKHLQKDYNEGVFVGVYENHRAEEAHAEITRLLDADHDGELSAEERAGARVILYGHSWGASEAIALARRLQNEHIPVLLTLQVDSIAKKGEDDAVIPANVAEAANFYQPDGLLHGRAAIRASDPARTQILGNFRFDYKTNPIRCSQYPWYDRVFMKSHIEIECDPTVWAQVEKLIRAKLPSLERAQVTQQPAK